MPDQRKPYLCGGVFLTQLMQARKPRAGVREHYAGDSDGLSDPETMLAFIKVMSPDFTAPAGQTFKENTSSYKNCRKNSGTYLPFAADSAEVRAFDECVRYEYTKALTRMVSFTDDFIEVGTKTKKDEYLVQELVEIIRDDEDSVTSKEATHLYRLQQWGEAVKDCKSSGKTVGAWCSEQGISKKSYYNWQKQVRDAACAKRLVE